MNFTRRLALTTLFCFALTPLYPIAAEEVSIPHNFSPGTPAKASEVNENFAALKNAAEKRQNRVTGTCQPGDAIRAIADDGTVTCSSTPRSKVTVFPLDVSDLGLNSDTDTGFVKLKDIGLFNKEYDNSKIVVSYQDIPLASRNTTTCFLQVRVDDLQSNGDYSPPVIMVVGIMESVMSSTGVFEGLPAGDHTLSLWYRTKGGDCDRNLDALAACQVTVMEIP